MPFGIKIERDEQVDFLNQQVNTSLHKLALELDPDYFRVEDKQAIKFVSFEDAVKELAALKNS